MPILRMSVATCLRPTPNPSRLRKITKHSATGERMLKVQLVDTAHQRQVGPRGRQRFVVHRGARQLQQLRLAHDRQPMRDRSSFCARIADATERAGQKIYRGFPFLCKTYVGNGSDCESITGLSTDPDWALALMETARLALIRSAASNPAGFFARFTKRRSDLSPSTRLARSFIQSLLVIQQSVNLVSYAAAALASNSPPRASIAHTIRAFFAAKAMFAL